MKYFLLYSVFLFIFGQGCKMQGSRNYVQLEEVMRIKSPDKAIAVFLYRPWDCVGCNLLVNNILNDSSFMRLTGGNILFLQKTVRDIELPDFKASLPKIYGQDLQISNSAALYDTLNAAISGQLYEGQSVLLFVKRDSDSINYVFIKDPQAISKIKNIH